MSQSLQAVVLLNGKTQIKVDFIHTKNAHGWATPKKSGLIITPPSQAGQISCLAQDAFYRHMGKEQADSNEKCHVGIIKKRMLIDE